MIPFSGSIGSLHVIFSSTQRILLFSYSCIARQKIKSQKNISSEQLLKPVNSYRNSLQSTCYMQSMCCTHTINTTVSETDSLCESLITGGNNYFGRRFKICFLKCRNTCVSESGRLEASGDRYKRSAG